MYAALKGDVDGVRIIAACVATDLYARDANGRDVLELTHKENVKEIILAAQAERPPPPGAAAAAAASPETDEPPEPPPPESAENRSESAVDVADKSGSDAGANGPGSAPTPVENVGCKCVIQ